MSNRNKKFKISFPINVEHKGKLTRRWMYVDLRAIDEKNAVAQFSGALNMLIEKRSGIEGCVEWRSFMSEHGS